MSQEKNLTAQEVFDLCREYMTPAHVDYVKKAYQYAAKMHAGQKRESGEPYIIHPIQVAGILAKLKMDYVSVAAGFLHDVVEDTPATLDDIEREFGPDMRVIIDGLTKMSKMQYVAHTDLLAENHRKLLLAMAKDIRVIIVKLADRLHNMRTLMYTKPEKQRRIASETLEIYAPLADRLGISAIKWELEDLSLRYLNPQQYYRIAHLMHSKRAEREAYINEAITEIKKALAPLHISYQIYGRPKHIYSIYKKMHDKHKRFDELYDLLAVRIVTKSVRDCYAVLGAIHTQWRPLPGRFKDYIALPKSNMYQSIHTTIMGPQGKPLEIQIRTEKMHYVAEYGIAAHWAYKEGHREPLKLNQDDQQLNLLHEILEVQDESKDATEFMRNVKENIFANQVYVFSPKGDVFELPKGAITLDFAYAVHTEVGNHTVGAKINGRIVPLNTQLKNGNWVEILTSSNAVPHRDWLKMVFTARARNKINRYFKHLDEENETAKETKKTTITHQDTKTTNNPEVHVKEKKTLDDNLGIIVPGVNNVLVHLAKCCRPIPGDDIVGYVTKGYGVTVHRRNCPTIAHTMPERLIPVEWTKRASRHSYNANLVIYGYHRDHILNDVLQVIGSCTQFSGRVANDKTVKITVTVSVHDIDSLQHLMQQVKSIPDIYSVKRTND